MTIFAREGIKVAAFEGLGEHGGRLVLVHVASVERQSTGRTWAVFWFCRVPGERKLSFPDRACLRPHPRRLGAFAVGCLQTSRSKEGVLP